MRPICLLLIALLITTLAPAQSNPDFVDAQKQGDACFAKRDWPCAQQQYRIALAIKPGDSYCQQRLNETKKAIAAQTRQRQQAATAERQAIAAERAQLEAERRAFERRQAAARQQTVTQPPIQNPAPRPARQTNNSPRANMVWVPGGTFQMGSNEVIDDEKPIHTVTVSGFWMDQYEVTQRKWESVMGNNPSGFENCPRCPVETVSWTDTQEFIAKLNAQTGKRFRLPTEAEWEYAARERGKDVRFGNGKDIADPAEMNFNGTEKYKQAYSIAGIYREKTTEVGSFSPNALGLYDMSGNVWEWCADWYGPYESGSVTNPTGLYTGSNRVLRGGSWIFDPQGCRAAARGISTPAYRYYFIGFRLVSQ